MRRLLSLLLSAALALSLSGCTPATQSSGSQSASAEDASGNGATTQPISSPFSLAVYPSYSLHPVLAENRANLTLAPLLYEPLFQVNNAFQAVPVLCQHYTVSEDKLSWVFTLYSDITFSDGTPLTGQVVAAALNTARQANSRYAQRLRSVSAITAEGQTITITLTQPNGALPVLLDIPIALDTGERPLGTGPYRLSGQDDLLSLTARSSWWQEKTLPAQEIPLTAVTKSDDMISSFASGGVGLADLDLMGTNALGYSGNYETWDYPTTDFLYLGFNTQSGLCRSAAVRLALAQSIDRDSIVQVDYALHAVATTLPVHPASPLYDQNMSAALGYEPEALASQLEQLHLSGRTLTLLVNSENSAKASIAQRIAYQFEAAGIAITLDKLPFEDYTAALASGNFDLYLGEVVLTADFDLSALVSPGGALNYGGWWDEQVNGLLAAVRGAQGDDQLVAARTLFAHLNQQVPIAPICFKNGSVLTQWGRLSGLTPIRGNVFYCLENWQIK